MKIVVDTSRFREAVSVDAAVPLAKVKRARRPDPPRKSLAAAQRLSVYRKKIQASKEEGETNGS